MISIKECGVFVFKLYDQEGNLLEEKRASNMLTSEGSARMLNLSFNSSAAGGQTSYVGLIDNSGYSAIAIADEAADIRQTGTAAAQGWTEILDASNYTARQAGTFGVTDNGGTATASKATWTDATFTFSGSHTLKGAFVANNSTVGANSGANDALIATAIFSTGVIAVDATTTLKVTFEMTLS